MKSKILSWEFVKTIQARVKVGSEEGFPQFLEMYFKYVNLVISLVMEQQGARKVQNYHSKVTREDMIAQGARAGLQRRRNEQLETRKNSIKNEKQARSL